ncbi:hypothetical protein ACWEQA_04085 [Nocardia sp. NPDC004085]
MTAPQNQDAPPVEETGGELPPIEPYDPVLADLVQLINLLGDTEIGITVHAAGAVISGALISGRRHFDLMIAAIRSSPSAISTAFGDWFEPVATRYRDDENRSKQVDEDAQPQPLPPVAFIHLRDAKTFAPGGGTPLVSNLWRGRLSEISGWSLGNYGELTPPPDFN